MAHGTTKVSGTTEILVGGPHTLTPIRVSGRNGGGLVLAGTPLNGEGKESNNAEAAGILLYDVDTDANPNGTIVMGGQIDSVKAQTLSGVQYTDEMKKALKNVIFRTDITDSKITVISLDVTENGVYEAPYGKAYSPVRVNVSGGGGSSVRYGDGLMYDSGTNTVSVDTAKSVESGNSKPVTSDAVYVQMGNIETILSLL